MDQVIARGGTEGDTSESSKESLGDEEIEEGHVGMVLFNSSQIPDPIDPSPTSTSTPLDENLFSDLTLTSPFRQSPPPRLPLQHRRFRCCPRSHLGPDRSRGGRRRAAS
ncbi:hypothetical protein Syun_021028 [Stephania yunnanensis]|uniref:Uncharacterized protein n=1 Tax=Stephania yunnanensis TaxID=152371 RepID=A0AAP0IF04_9MAGN